MTQPIQQILTLAEAYAAHRALSDSRVSTLAFGDGNMIRRLRGGSDITTGRAERTMRWFSENWPEGAAWPEGVPRPAVEAPAGAGAS